MVTNIRKAAEVVHGQGKRSVMLRFPVAMIVVGSIGLVGAVGCDKSAPKKTSTATKKASANNAVEPAPGGASEPSKPAQPTGQAAAPKGGVAQASAPAAASDDGTIAPLPGGPALRNNAIPGLDLAGATRGVLSGGLTFEPGKQVGSEEDDVTSKPTSSDEVDDSMVPVRKAAERHASCQKLLDCTKAALALAPGSVTSYNVTRESVDSLDSAEAEGECAGDLKDIVDILKHLKKALPKECT